jgi:exosome complex RNA-binding protein Csl4
LMEKRDNMLVCSRCGSRERRRTVLKYGKIEALEELLGAH